MFMHVGLRAGKFVEVGIRMGRFVEVRPQADRFVEAYDILKAMLEYLHDVMGCVGLIYV